MRKILIALGTTAAVALPISTVVACGETDKLKIGDHGTLSADINKMNDVKEPIPNDGNTYDLTTNYKVGGKFVDVDKDKAIMDYDHYHGNLLDRSKSDDTHALQKDSYLEVSRDGATAFGQKDSIMLGKGDSIIFLFDDDDNDGLSINNFASTHYIEDTSMNSNMADIYKGLPGIHSEKISGGTAIWLPFDKVSETTGRMTPWIGSQSNHSTDSYEEAMSKIKKEYSKNIYDSFVNYYATANKGFIPTIIPANLITYRQIAKNAIKVEFNPDGNFSITGALMHAIPEAGAKNPETKGLGIGPLSIGGYAEWKAYQKIAYDPYNPDRQVSVWASKYKDFHSEWIESELIK